MPRTNNPWAITTGFGLTPIQPTEVGTGTNLDAHVDNLTGAHAATAISVENTYDRYYLAPNVQGSLDELAALVPPTMGGVGSAGVAWLGSSNSGVPDWGILKLNDGALPFTGNVGADSRWVYPYYYRAPICASGVGMTGTGLQTATDPTFNVYDAGVPAYTGGGTGLCHAGFSTFPLPTGMGGNLTGYPTWTLMTALANPAAVVSGIVSPADRGVLALVKWPTGGEPDVAAAANVTDIQSRCMAAILLGQGLAGGTGGDGMPGGGVFIESSGPRRATGQMNNNTNPAAPYTVTIDLTGLTGGPTSPSVFTATAVAPTTPFEFQVAGGAAATMDNLALAINTLYFPHFLYAANVAGVIQVTIATAGTLGNSVTLATSCAPGDFAVTGCLGGTDDASSPFNLPGRAAGQFNLDEIHTGTTTGFISQAPFYNPAAGQVRLLTDASAVSFSPGTVAGGLPILGATTSAIGSTVPVAYLPYSLGGGTDGNFFAYRLPYLKDYSVATGLHYTPLGETVRFTSKLPPASGGVLTQAGDYADFTADFWAYQVARYRHRFVLAVGGAASRADGNYALVHFKKESYFEAYVRDGVVPTSDHIYSVNLQYWTGNVAPFNLVNNVVSGTPSPSFTMSKAEIVEDNNGTVVPAVVAPSYTLTTVGMPTVIFYSGVSYYVPIDVTTASDPNLAITDLTFGYAGLWNRGYRSHDKVPTGGLLSADNRKVALNQNPVFISLSSFSYEGNEVGPTSTITTTSATTAVFPGELGEIRRQRIELGYTDLTAGNTNPDVADAATYAFSVTVPPDPLTDGICFTGDTTTPVFTRDAKVRVFLRRPLVVDGVYGYSEPVAGLGSNIPNSTGDVILFHSMQEGGLATAVPYGNPTNTAIRGLSATKDTQERFLDEIYRYPENWVAAVPLAPATVTELRGPGTSTPGGINVPVRPDTGVSFDGWYLQNFHQIALDNVTAPYDVALQVAGLPPRNPPYSEGLLSPFPSRGVLMYPKTDYSAGHDPAGPDYSALTGDRTYVRAFDAGAANVGNETIGLRLWGIEDTDFDYTIPTAPGGAGIAIMVKIPGKTVWMDAGRTDGAGNKQDAVNDGAGCRTGVLVATDATSQLRYTNVAINLGAAGALFLNLEGKCPVLVKVIIKDNATGKALDFANVAETAATSTCRGLVGIDIL